MTGLAVPIPASITPGQFDTAALWNANVYNGLTFLLNPPTFSGYQQTLQSLPSGSFVPMAIDDTAIDSYGGHSNATNNSRYVAQVAGWYSVAGTVGLAPNASGGRGAQITVNGTFIPGMGIYVPNGASFDQGISTPVRECYLNVGDYVELQGFQSSGAALTTVIDAGLRTVLWLRWSHA